MIEVKVEWTLIVRFLLYVPLLYFVCFAGPVLLSVYINNN
jgi:hypothetical protein